MPNSAQPGDPQQHNPLRNQRPTPRPRAEDVQVEPLPALEWSLAVETAPTISQAHSPAALRIGWLHRAPENQVVELFRRLGAESNRVPAPWWLPALESGAIPSREHAHRLEDEVHSLLHRRPGWDFVPWGQPGETGYWEYLPLDRPGAALPATVYLTSRHSGWVDVLPPHDAEQPAPVEIDGPDGLSAWLTEIESW